MFITSGLDQMYIISRRFCKTKIGFQTTKNAKYSFIRGDPIFVVYFFLLLALPTKFAMPRIMNILSNCYNNDFQSLCVFLFKIDEDSKSPRCK